MSTEEHASLSIVVYDGHFDKIHYALAMASSAAALDKPATLFFTMDAVRALMTDTDGNPAWRALPVSRGTHANGGAMDDELAEKFIGTFEELLRACLDMGVTVMVCEMGLKACDLGVEHLRDDIPVTPGGLVTFLTHVSKDGSVVFI